MIMKKRSVKVRITVWYTFFIVCLTVIFIASVLLISKKKDDEYIKDNLKVLVKTIASEIDDNNDISTIEENLNDKIDNNYVAIYNESGILISGTKPYGYESDVKFDNKDSRTEIIDGRMYYIYDKKENTQKGTVWVRGFAHALSVSDMVNNIVKVVCVVFPFMIAFMIAGGYLISAKALKPLEAMNEAADEINEGNDLTKRVAVGEYHDEISRLGITLNSMWQRLEKSFDNEKRFISDASHELRTPTSVIMAQCELCLESQQDNETYRNALELIQRQGNKLKKLISELLEISRLDSIKQQKILEKTNVSELVEIICEEQKLIHGDSNIELDTDIETDISTNINIMLFTRACTNLISNAYQYGKVDGKIVVSLRKSIGKDGRYNVVFMAEDDGIGLSEKDREKVWERFYQVDEARTNDGSMGLGLSMVKRIAEYHDGKAEVESIIGKGSIFIITLPIK
jgi:signal transduction histidine kinase